MLILIVWDGHSCPSPLISILILMVDLDREGHGFSRAANLLCLSQRYIEQRQPILKGLQSKPAKEESDTEYPKPPLRKIVSVIFYVRIERHPDAGDNPCHQPDANRKKPGVVYVMDESATEKGRGCVADSAHHSSPKQTARKPWTARRCIIGGRTHAVTVGEYLADRDENGKCDGESEAQNPIQSNSQTQTANGGKQSLPGKGVMIHSTSRSTEFNRQGDTSCNPGSQAKEGTKTEAVADAEYNGVGYRAGKQP